MILRRLEQFPRDHSREEDTISGMCYLALSRRVLSYMGIAGPIRLRESVRKGGLKNRRGLLNGKLADGTAKNRERGDYDDPSSSPSSPPPELALLGYLPLVFPSKHTVFCVFEVYRTPRNMPSDVEMSNPDPVVQVEDLSPPHHTPITVDDDSLPPTSPSAVAPFATTGDLSSTSSSHDVEEALNPTKEKGKRSKPPSAAKAAASATGAKPKSTKPAPRSPSPSPPPPPSRPPLQTIRLDITLGGPDNYEVDISALAKETGQRPATPVPAKRDTSDDSHSEGDDEADNKPQDKKRKRVCSLASLSCSYY